MKKLFILLIIVFAGIYSANAQWTLDSLSAPAFNLVPQQVGTKAIFASNAKYEIYDFTTGLWTSKTFLPARTGIKAVANGGKAYFAGGGFITVWNQVMYKNIDIYNSATNVWSTANLSQARSVGATAAVGNKVLFAGGRQVLAYSNRVDIFDVNTGVRTTTALSQARNNMAVAIIGSKVIFAGGESGSIVNGVYSASNKVDIYDDATGLWSTALLSSKRELITVGVVGTKVLFAGGRNPNGVYQKSVDIYDAATNIWSVVNMSQPKYGMASATVGNKVYFAGGTTANSGALTNRVEVYDATTNTWSFITISSPRMNMTVAQTPQRVMFAGGTVVWGNTGTDRVEVLDIASGTWSVEYLAQPRFGIAAISYGNKALFAGGAEVWSSYPQYSIYSNKVDIWTDLPPRLNGEEMQQSSAGRLNVYPNPSAESTVNVYFIQNETKPVTIRLVDLTGRVITEMQTNGENEIKHVVDISGLAAGTYIVSAEADDYRETVKLMVIR
jgi:hypothetical protein